MRPPKLRADRFCVTRVLVRPATPADADPVTELIVDTPGGLTEILSSREGALRVVRRTFLDPASFFGFPHTLVADDEGAVVGEMVRLSGSRWKRLRLRTEVGMLAAGGPRVAWRLTWRGSVAGSAMAPIPDDVLYVASLSVAAASRGRGIGTELLRWAAQEAREARLRSVAVDVAYSNEAAIRFYVREGFSVPTDRRHQTAQWLPAGGSIRMERPVSG